MEFNGGKIMKADWDKIRRNNFFSGNYYHFATPRTEREARRFALTRTWTGNTIFKHNKGGLK
jgi:hypothetical protein